MEAIERSWENYQNQCRAYELIAELYRLKNDFAKSNVYFDRQLSIAKETKYSRAERMTDNYTKQPSTHTGNRGCHL